jgi:hypothetical protein
LLPGDLADSRVSLLVERSALSTTHMPLTMTGVLPATAPPPLAKVAVPCGGLAGQRRRPPRRRGP